MSSAKRNEAGVRAEEPELSDEALEQVAGGCEIDSQLMDPPILTCPICPIDPIGPLDPVDPTIRTID